MNRGIVNQLAIKPLPVPKELTPQTELEPKKTMTESIMVDDIDDEENERLFKVVFLLSSKNLSDFSIILT